MFCGATTLRSGIVTAGLVAVLFCASATLGQQPNSESVAGSEASADPTLTAQPGAGTLSFSTLRENALERLKASASAGDAAAALVLARHYLGPQTTAEDHAEALVYLEQGAALGITEAHLMLGDLYRDGPGDGPPDFVRAAEHYAAASASGDNAARRHFAAMLLVRRGEGDVDKALSLLSDAAASGDTGAAITLADIYAEGVLVPRNGARAIALYDLGLVTDTLDAITGLADLYRVGAPDLPADPAQAALLYEQASSLGDRPAKQKLAEMYINGEGVAADLDKGIALLEELAALGQASALVNLGDIFANGEVVEADGAKAVDYYERAAEIGDFASIVRIADLYRDGVPGFPPNLVEAVPFYEEAADEGNNDARKALAQILLFGGEGVPADAARATDLLKTAAESGDAEAAEILAQITSQAETPS
jgi:uncharacterized protein